MSFSAIYIKYVHQFSDALGSLLSLSQFVLLCELCKNAHRITQHLVQITHLRNVCLCVQFSQVDGVRRMCFDGIQSYTVKTCEQLKRHRAKSRYENENQIKVERKRKQHESSLSRWNVCWVKHQLQLASFKDWSNYYLIKRLVIKQDLRN